MFRLYGNGKLMEECETEKECKEMKKDYIEVTKAMLGRCNIKFKIVEENQMGNFEVIYDDEDVIGKVREVKKCFMKHLADIILDEEIEMGEKTNQLSLIAELIEKLGNESDNTIIKVSFNPMGAFNYSHLSWEE